jgi:hypothetical protein
LSPERLRRFADFSAWRNDMSGLANGLSREVMLTPAGERTMYQLGSPGARDRIWIQCDAASDRAAAGAVAWALLESLTSDRVSQYRHIVLGRCLFAIITAAEADGPNLRALDVPVLDAGTLGATPDVMQRMRHFVPTLVIHIQDWTSEEPRVPSRGSWWGASNVDALEAAQNTSQVLSGLRQVESYFISPDLYRRMVVPGALRPRFGRPTPVARALADHPDGRLGTLARRYMGRMGFTVLDRGKVPDTAATQSAVRVAPGRYVPRPEWRRLGGGNLAELALTRFGCVGLSVQLLHGPAAERVGRALALAEGAIIHRLGLEAKDPET